MLLDLIKAIILGVVEGFTEFLPISSTGHLVLINEYISFEKNFTFLFDIVIQMGAILAVVFYFWKKIWPPTKNKDIWSKMMVALLPVIILGGLFAKTIEERLFNVWTVAITLILGGLIILVVEKSKINYTIKSMKDLSLKTAFFIGLIQCLSFLPGTSRSGATIIGAMILGVSRPIATEFSFFLAIPTMLLASIYSLIKYSGSLSFSEIIILLTGFFVAFGGALGVVKFLINFVQKNNFKVFGYYRIILGLVIIIYFLIK